MEEKIYIGGDFNCHICKDNDGFYSVHWSFGFDDKNEGGRDILAFVAVHDLCIVNLFFKKKGITFDHF